MNRNYDNKTVNSDELFKNDVTGKNITVNFIKNYSEYIKQGDIYIGELDNSETHGFGKLFRNGQLLYNGLWLRNVPIDVVNVKNTPTLPELPVLNQTPSTRVCNKLKLAFNSKNTFEFEYYIPFSSNYDIKKIVEKAVLQTNVVEDDSLNNEESGVNIVVTNSICDLENISDSFIEANNVNLISKYITNNLSYICSNCKRFNRGWVCCGQFAPFLFVFYNLISDEDFNKFKDTYKTLKLDNNMPKQNYIENIAMVFYKLFTYYAEDSYLYQTTINDLIKYYNVDIPNIGTLPEYWYIQYNDSDNKEMFKNNTSYLLTITNTRTNIDVYHFSFIHRYNDYIIICDSWSSGNIGKRMPITRIILLSEFIKCLNKLNELHKELIDLQYVNYDTEMLEDTFALYNFIIDGLFIVPYNKKYIKGSYQSFFENNLSEIRIVDPNMIYKLFNELSKGRFINNKPIGQGAPFYKVLMMGGNNKGKKRKSNKSKKRKSLKEKRKYNKSRKNKISA